MWKNLDFYCFVTSVWFFFIFEYTLKRNKHKNIERNFFLESWRAPDEKSRIPESDPLVIGTDPRIRIRTKNHESRTLVVGYRYGNY